MRIGRLEGLAWGWASYSRLFRLAYELRMGFYVFKWSLKKREGFPGGAVVKNPSASAGDTGSTPGLGRSHMPRSN